MTKEVYTKWEETTGIVETKLSGNISETEIKEWIESLDRTFAKIPTGTKFKIFVNFYGLNPISVLAHKSYRAVIPVLLSKYNWRVGYLDLFEEAKDLRLTTTNEIECLAAVHCHHDSYKMKEYENRFARESEHFLDDPEKSDSWIRSFSKNQS